MMPLKDPVARRQYHTDYMKKYLAKPKNHSHHLRLVRINRKRNKELVHKLVAEFKTQGCQASNCSETEPCCLTAHHLDPKKKEFGIFEAASRGISAKRVEKELAKCTCLCMNCHAKFHAGKIRFDAGWSNPVARRAHNPEVARSNRAPATN